MKKVLSTLVVVAGLVAMPATGRAHDAYDDSQSHPLRIVAYAVHPIGYALEWLVTRPLHFAVSQKSVERVFGHTAHEHPFGDYEAYSPDEGY